MTTPCVCIIFCKDLKLYCAFEMDGKAVVLVFSNLSVNQCAREYKCKEL